MESKFPFLFSFLKGNADKKDVAHSEPKISTSLRRRSRSTPKVVESYVREEERKGFNKQSKGENLILYQNQVIERIADSLERILDVMRFKVSFGCIFQRFAVA